MTKSVISRIPFAPLSALISILVRNGGVDLRRLHHLLGMVLRYGLLEPDQEGGEESVLERVVLGDPHFLQVKKEMEKLEADQKFQDRYGDRKSVV